MPKLYVIGGYAITIWQNENGEPVHVHVQKGRAKANSTKIWILSNGDVQVVHNRSRVPEKDLKHICEFLRNNSLNIVNFWLAYHGYIKYYK